MMPPLDEVTPNGTDLTLATNVLGELDVHTYLKSLANLTDI